jgi:hypothetical protein
MEPNRNDKLEKWAGHTLRQLPGRRAPAGLSARVLAEIRRRAEAPWYQRPWLEWHPAAKVASCAMLPALGYFVWGVALPWLKEALFAAPITKDATATYEAMGSAAAAIGRAGLLTVSQANHTVLIGAAAVFAVAWFSTLGLGTACWRLARSKNWN